MILVVIVINHSVLRTWGGPEDTSSLTSLSPENFLTLSTPTPQNGQTIRRQKPFECVDYFVGLAYKGFKTKTNALAALPNIYN